MISQAQSIPNVLIKFAESLGVELTTNKLDIPAQFGSGYCSGYVFNKNMRVLISDYVLHKDLIIEQPEELASGRLLFFKFQHIFPPVVGKPTQSPSVLIATRRISTGDSFSIHSNTETINIEIDVDYLNALLQPAAGSQVLQGLLQDAAPLFFEQLIDPTLLKVVGEILTPVGNDIFRPFFLRIKAEELICRLLMELDNRTEKQLYPVNEKDISMIYQIRDRMISTLATPPLIADLALEAAMSPTKLKQLFRQIFGYSIFNYYQHFRMKEAARLLKTENISVAAVGYQLGFTNLSHFSNLFDTHIGMKPKRYTQTSAKLRISE